MIYSFYFNGQLFNAFDDDFISIFGTMSETLKCKFHCNSIITDTYSEEAKLSAIYARNEAENKEDNQFSEATPSGNLNIQVSNPDAKGFFKPGIEYYLKIEACPRERQSNPELFDKHFKK